MITCIAMGDMGKGGADQYKVAKAIQKIYKQRGIQFVLGLGDNMYPNGCETVDDPLFYTNFEKPYSILPDDRWYMCMGNHDYGYTLKGCNGQTLEGCSKCRTIKDCKDNSQSQIDYTRKSTKWFMPSKYYSFVKGPVEFFYLDTNLDRQRESDIKKQLKTMKDKLDKCKKTWKVVVGHHTWRSIAAHGNAKPRLERFLNELFKDTKPSLYMGGHDHCNSLITKDGIPIVISGVGGERYDNTVNYQNMHDCQVDYFSPELGFTVLNFTAKNMNIDFYNVK